MNSASSTIQKEPKSSSYLTKHLCNDKLVRIAFCILGVFGTLCIQVFLKVQKVEIVVEERTDRKVCLGERLGDYGEKERKKTSNNF